MIYASSQKMNTNKYQNKYRIESTRLQDYDYTRAGLYFITICTQNREHYFGKIVNGKIQLSNIGILADVFWNETKRHSKNIELHQFVVMPNHIHGILEIVTPEISHNDYKEKDEACIVSTDKNDEMAAISPKSHSISIIIGSYKSAVTKHAHRLGYVFEWQHRFYDHIIRDKKDYIRISNYIENNPKKWNQDKFNEKLT